MTKNQDTSISIEAGTTVSGGTINGNVSGGTVSMGPVSAGSAPEDLAVLLRQLKAGLATAGLPKQDTTTDHLDGVIEQTRAAEPKPAVGWWCWQKVTAALAGLKQFDDLVDRIARHLTELWPG